MIVEPKIRTMWKLDDNGHAIEKGVELRDIPSATGDGLYLDCVAVHPKSAVGKNVTVRIPPEMIALALKTVKEFAIRQRSVALKGSEGQNDD